jgi:hypothetical protein
MTTLQSTSGLGGAKLPTRQSRLVNASNIQRAIQAHSAPSFSETAKKFWKRQPQKASIHAG